MPDLSAFIHSTDDKKILFNIDCYLYKGALSVSLQSLLPDNGHNLNLLCNV